MEAYQMVGILGAIYHKQAISALLAFPKLYLYVYKPEPSLQAIGEESPDSTEQPTG